MPHGWAYKGKYSFHSTGPSNFGNIVCFWDGKWVPISFDRTEITFWKQLNKEMISSCTIASSQISQQSTCNRPFTPLFPLYQIELQCYRHFNCLVFSEANMTMRAATNLEFSYGSHDGTSSQQSSTCLLPHLAARVFNLIQPSGWDLSCSLVAIDHHF